MPPPEQLNLTHYSDLLDQFTLTSLAITKSVFKQVKKLKKFLILALEKLSAEILES